MCNVFRASVAGLMVGLALLASGAAQATSHDGENTAANTIRALEARVTELEKRIEQLEALKPGFAAFMPRFSERFHVLHRAGDIGDWQVAKHEVLEMQRLVDVSKNVDPQLGGMFEGFMSGPLTEINAAIEHENGERFLDALDQTVQNCNACHQAVGSGFIRVSLNVPSLLSMRHAHELKETSIEGMEHTHEH